MRTLWIATALLAVLTFAGCGRRAAKDNSLPAAGQMKIISITDVAAPERGSLLKNGDFDEWFAGAAMPDGAQVPDSKHSTLKRAAQLDTSIKSRNQVEQMWLQDDADSPPGELFAVFGEGFQPDTTYTLRAIATGRKNERTKASLSVYEVNDGAYDLLAKDLVTTTYDRCRAFTGTFKTKKGGRVAVVSNIAGFQKDDDKVCHRVTWHSIAVLP